MQFRRAHSAEEALEELYEWGDDACVLAGGTDVMVQHQHRQISAGALIHIGGIEQLESITTEGNTVVGALTTHRRLATNVPIAARQPALARAAATVGGWQTQSVGTLGGNVCNASPAADTVAPLLVADAEVALASKRTERRVPLQEFIIGRRMTARRPDELLISIELDPLPPNCAEVYLKVGRRTSMDVAVVGLAVRLGFADDGGIVSARIATCSVAPTPKRVSEAETILVGTRLDEDAVAHAGQALVESSDPIDDARATASYRRRVLPGLLARALADCSMQAARRVAT